VEADLHGRQGPNAAMMRGGGAHMARLAPNVRNSDAGDARLAPNERNLGRPGPETFRVETADRGQL
jgi:hypothetical protein